MIYDPIWPDLFHPHAAAIDTPLPPPPHNVHIMLGSKAAWVEPAGRPGDARFDVYPDFSLAEWHARHTLASDGEADAPTISSVARTHRFGSPRSLLRHRLRNGKASLGMWRPAVSYRRLALNVDWRPTTAGGAP